MCIYKDILSCINIFTRTYAHVLYTRAQTLVQDSYIDRCVEIINEMYLHIYISIYINTDCDVHIPV